MCLKFNSVSFRPFPAASLEIHAKYSMRDGNVILYANWKFDQGNLSHRFEVFKYYEKLGVVLL